MLTVEEFKSLHTGDVVEIGTLFKGLSQEQVNLRVISTLEDRVDFVGTWLGVTIGRWSAKLNENQTVEWVSS